MEFQLLCSLVCCWVLLAEHRLWQSRAANGSTKKMSLAKDWDARYFWRTWLETWNHRHDERGHQGDIADLLSFSRHAIVLYMFVMERWKGSEVTRSFRSGIWSEILPALSSIIGISLWPKDWLWSLALERDNTLAPVPPITLLFNCWNICERFVNPAITTYYYTAT